MSNQFIKKISLGVAVIITLSAILLLIPSRSSSENGKKIIQIASFVFSS